LFDIAQAMEDAGLGSASDFLRVAETQTQLVSDFAPEAKSLEGIFSEHLPVHAHAEPGRDGGGDGAPVPAGSAADRAERGRAQGGDHGVDRGERDGGCGGASRVASVYYNRLGLKMALDADPSVIYASTDGDVFGEPSSRRSGGEISV